MDSLEWERPAAAGIDGDYLFECVVTDLHWSALQVAGVARLFNAQARFEAGSDLYSWRHALFCGETTMQPALRYAREVGLKRGPPRQCPDSRPTSARKSADYATP